MGIVIKLFNYGTVHAAKIRYGKSDLERAVQYLYLTEYRYWKCNNCIETNKVNYDDPEQEPRRSKRTAAAIAKVKIRDKIEDEIGVTTIE